ncbi:hypothetical protein CspeluHIS016_0207400 [Cutaneotrichosporon spelunceum]|uniref:Transmembrane protein n=1 Tax=Cutaneotrichosporon spelunceum TaxID=1672016 RepID=A0AAD3TS80_9TREE|nr:hypothetical protein CspeluHIS016_0207400 [Cutaneotrichosporon spelunceum]
MLDFWPRGAWMLSESENGTIATANSSTPVELAFTFIGSTFTIDAMWDTASDFNVTADGAVPPLNLTRPMEGKLAAGVHSLNVTALGGVRVAGVTWDGPTGLTQVAFTLDGELVVVNEVSWAGEWAIESTVHAPHTLAVGRGNASVYISLPDNTSSFELRGLVAPGAGSFTLDLDPPIRPRFIANTDSNVRDPTALLYSVSLDRHERYTVKVSASSGSVYLLDWGYALDCGGECFGEPPVQPQRRSANSRSAIVGGVLGGVFGLFALLSLLMVCWFCCQLRRRRLSSGRADLNQRKDEEHQFSRVDRKCEAVRMDTDTSRSRGTQAPCPSLSTLPPEALDEQWPITPAAGMSATPSTVHFAPLPWAPPAPSPKFQQDNMIVRNQGEISVLAREYADRLHGQPEVGRAPSPTPSTASSNYLSAGRHMGQEGDAFEIPTRGPDDVQVAPP